jgi:beta-phosphoglucomutase-like phosphatase (HAD superfamily)
MRNEQIIPRVVQVGLNLAIPKKIRELADKKEQLYRELIRRDGLQALGRGSRACFTSFAKTESPARLARPPHVQISRPHSNSSDWLTVLMPSPPSEDVSKGKPDPEVFLIAASKIDRQT